MFHFTFTCSFQNIEGFYSILLNDFFFLLLLHFFKYYCIFQYYCIVFNASCFFKYHCTFLKMLFLFFYNYCIFLDFIAVISILLLGLGELRWIVPPESHFCSWGHLWSAIEGIWGHSAARALIPPAGPGARIPISELP